MVVSDDLEALSLLNESSESVGCGVLRWVWLIVIEPHFLFGFVWQGFAALPKKCA